MSSLSGFTSAQTHFDHDREREAAVQELHLGEKLRWWHDGWRSAAEHGQRLWRLLQDQADFLTWHRQMVYVTHSVLETPY
ncbi:hypothetical protein [Sinorhizobium psoraleae]|uniref:Uncharacterized protein n=1 Tax=Sinorhizobium psoraleae TaxID=520838 RepID=A0ABT4KR60_9HYPH|nr:hypothetical protein [Sinorhizobium psoraleae]MCZ4093372.1 hypothetical protein [Sinorhizobium psoraleae]